jgi:hypothetical protein
MAFDYSGTSANPAYDTTGGSSGFYGDSMTLTGIVCDDTNKKVTGNMVYPATKTTSSGSCDRT